MGESKQYDDFIPEHFTSIEAAAEFWDNHDLADYWNLTKEVNFEVDIQRRVFLTPIEPGLVQELAKYARQQGISTETLINLWLAEKLTAVTQNRKLG